MHREAAKAGIPEEWIEAARRSPVAADNPLRGRVNLLSWDGKGLPEGIFPSSPEEDK